MPIYVYKCRECKHELEELQKFDDPPPARCPSCGAGSALERHVGPTNFQLVGSGWAKDGYA